MKKLCDNENVSSIHCGEYHPYLTAIHDWTKLEIGDRDVLRYTTKCEINLGPQVKDIKVIVAMAIPMDEKKLTRRDEASFWKDYRLAKLIHVHLEGNSFVLDMMGTIKEYGIDIGNPYSEKLVIAGESYFCGFEWK